MTLLVALGLPTTVKFWPVLASRVTGKKRLTTLIGTTTLRGSTEPGVLVVPLPGGGDCPYAADEREPVIAINSDASRVRCDPLCMMLMPPFIDSRYIDHSVETSI
jgi:hypothetical protein